MHGEQGLIFFLPNMTWGQPPYYTHQMIASTWQKNAVQVSAKNGADGIAITQAISAAVSDDSTQLVVRVVNMSGAQVSECGCAFVYSLWPLCHSLPRRVVVLCACVRT